MNAMVRCVLGLDTGWEAGFDTGWTCMWRRRLDSNGDADWTRAAQRRCRLDTVAGLNLVCADGLGHAVGLKAVAGLKLGIGRAAGTLLLVNSQNPLKK